MTCVLGSPRILRRHASWVLHPTSPVPPPKKKCILKVLLSCVLRTPCILRTPVSYVRIRASSRPMCPLRSCFIGLPGDPSLVGPVPNKDLFLFVLFFCFSLWYNSLMLLVYSSSLRDKYVLGVLEGTRRTLKFVGSESIFLVRKRGKHCVLKESIVLVNPSRQVVLKAQYVHHVCKQANKT